MSGNRFQLARGLAVPRMGPSQILVYSSGATTGATVSASVSSQAVAVMLLATTDCYVDINPTGTTVTTAVGHVMLANDPQIWEIHGGKEVVTVAPHSVVGQVHITELVAPNDV